MDPLFTVAEDCLPSLLKKADQLSNLKTKNGRRLFANWVSYTFFIFFFTIIIIITFV